MKEKAESSVACNHHRVGFLGLLVTLGIVFGDIGTSPLYVMKAILHTGESISESTILGALSCIIWTLTLQTTIKYVCVALRADNNGEGGILALYALLRRLKSKWIYLLAIIGASTLLADGIITPAITVTTAIEGLESISPNLPVIPITLGIITIIFFVQRFGTESIGKSFGVFMLLWFLLRKKPLSEAAGLGHCSGWTVGFCAFGAVGLYVLVSLVLALLPESWMEEYGKAMRLSTETGLIPALAVVAGAPVAEELVFRGVIQSRLERAMPVWIAIVLQAVLFGFIHGTPVQIGYAFLMGLLFGYIRYRTGSILPTIAAHAAFNAMNDPLGLLGGFAEKWQFLAVMAAVCAAGCVLCRRGLSGLRTAPEAEARSTSPTVCEEITE